MAALSTEVIMIRVESFNTLRSQTFQTFHSATVNNFFCEFPSSTENVDKCGGGGRRVRQPLMYRGVYEDIRSAFPKLND